MAAASPGGISCAMPGSVSAIPPTRVATTGVPHASASSGDMPPPSASDACTATSAACMYSHRFFIGWTAGLPMTHSSHPRNPRRSRARDEVLEAAAEIHHDRIEPAFARHGGRFQYGLGIFFMTDPARKQNHELAGRKLQAVAKARTLLALTRA